MERWRDPGTRLVLTAHGDHVGSYFEGGDGEIVALKLSDSDRLVARGHEHLAATLS